MAISKFLINPMARKVVRSWVNVEQEYVIRRLVYKCLPSEESDFDSLYHFTTYKCGSQAVRLIFSDPIVYRKTSLPPYFAALVTKHLDRKGFHTSVYSRPEQCLQAVANNSIFVIRNPVAMFKSLHHSNIVGHPLGANDDVASIRRTYDGLSVYEQYENTFHYFNEFIVSNLPDFSNISPSVFRFEDLFGSNAKEHWKILFERIHIDISDKEVSILLNRYSKKNLSGESINMDYKKYSRKDTELPPDIVRKIEQAIPSLYENKFY